MVGVHLWSYGCAQEVAYKQERNDSRFSSTEQLLKCFHNSTDTHTKQHSLKFVWAKEFLQKPLLMLIDSITGFIQKIATFFQGLFKEWINVMLQVKDGAY